MNDIDNMDVFYYFEVLCYKLKKKENKEEGNVLKGLPEDD